MKFPPFLAPDQSDEPPAASGDVVPFPKEIAARATLRFAQRKVEHLEQQAADNDARSRDDGERMRAIAAKVALEYWIPDLHAAEAAVAMLDADDTLTFRGRAYQAFRGFHGAN
jgi:hypothetical protein